MFARRTGRCAPKSPGLSPPKARQARADGSVRRLEPARYDLIVANPPTYEPQRCGSSAEYRREPRLALDGGRDGLEFTRRILLAARIFAPRGLLVVEIGRNRGKLERAFRAFPHLA